MQPQTAFAQQAEPFRRELFAHCYRMLGSIDEAEDAVQDTYLRAWRGFDEFRGEASLRVWLYRIATNVALNAFGKHRGRRWLPSALGGPLDDPDAAPENELDLLWVDPLPDQLVAARSDLRLALIAALQALPARQRAVLLLREVASQTAEEIAATLETTPAAVKSALQRARATLDAIRPSLEQVPEPTEPAARDLLARYMAAFETSDVAQLEEVLRDDAAIEVVPNRGWFAGKRTCLRYLGRVVGARGDWRTVPTSANGQPALVAYYRGAPWGVAVLDATSTGIARIVAFGNPRLAARFAAAG